MYPALAWQVDPTKILMRHELAAVLADLARQASRSTSGRLNLTIFRLACCCGLRVSEIAGSRMADVQLAGPRPHLRIRAAVGKGGRARRVPLWWDAGTLADLKAWHEERRRQGARDDDPFVCAVRGRWCGGPLSRHTLRRRFLTACKSLGHDRLRTLTIHHGRHTFISHALAGDRTLAEVRDAAGHTSVLTTSAYLHIAVDDNGTLGELF